MNYLWRGIEKTHPERQDWIVALQTICAANGTYSGNFLPIFGPRTERALRGAQNALGLSADGTLGSATLKTLLRAWKWDPPDSMLLAALSAGDLGQDVVDSLIDTATESRSTQPAEGLLPGWKDPAWPQPIDFDGDGRYGLTYINQADRQRLFGPMSFKIVDAYRGKVDVDDSWEAANVKTVVVPQLVGKTSYGKKMSGKVRFHRLVIAQLLGAFQEIEDAGLAHLILTWGGTYVPRLVRGSLKTLSTHAFAAAFDVNHERNGMGRQPALVGELGQIRSLVPILERWGFFWGGFFRRRKDGMHFEVVRILPFDEIVPMVAALEDSDHITPWIPAAA